jgi:putative ABC transport system permease protein
LGASAISLVTLLSKDFFRLAVIGNLTAWPIAYFLMYKWLQNFVYHTEIGPTIFIYSAVLTIVVALFTVSVQAIQTAFKNPINSIRYD